MDANRTDTQRGSTSTSKLHPYLPVLLTICLGATLSVTAFVGESNRQRNSANIKFERRSADLAAALEAGISTHLEVVRAVSALYSADEKVSREEFRTFVQHALSGHPGIQALEWIPRVPDSERAEYELAARKDGLPHFSFTEKPTKSSIVRAGRRAEYFPVYYVQPRTGNEAALGFDLGSNPARRATLAMARDTGKESATPRITLVQERGKEYGFLILDPVYRKGVPNATVEERRRNLMGFALGVFRIDDMVEGALRGLDTSGINLRLSDDSAPRAERILCARSNSPRRAGTQISDSETETTAAGPTFVRSLQVGNRRWSMLCVPSASWPYMERDWHALGALIAGLVLTFLVAAYLLASLRRAEQVARLAAELAGANWELEEEVADRNRADTALRESEERYRQLVEYLPDGIAVITHGRVTFANAACARLAGGESPADLMGRPALEFVHPQCRDEVQQSLEWVDAGGDPTPVTERKLLRMDGSVIYVETVAITFHQRGEHSGLVILRDITERKLAEAGLRIQTSAINAASDQIVITDAEGKIEFVNPAFERGTGFSVEEAVGRKPSIVKSGKHTPQFYADLWQTILAGATWRGEMTNRAKDGRLQTDDVTITPVKGDEGKIEHFIAIKRNISEKRMYEEQLDRLAHHDPLTGLPNRLLFGDRLIQSLGQARRSSESLAVMFLDLDHFKLVNDSLGHSVGDLLLKEASRRLSRTLREVDTIARMGGDEFTIIIGGVRSKGDAVKVARKTLGVLSKPYVLDGRELFLTASVGISVFPADGDDAETLVRNADAAMYRAKENGRNTYQLYEESLNAAAVERMTLEHGLRKAVENEEFVVHYQPEVDPKTGRVLGTEALVRWQHPTLGLVYPGQFIPLAEETGLILPMTSLVLKAACAQNKVWRECGLPPMDIAVNISASQFQQRDFKRTIADILEHTELDPRYLDLELTESTLMLNPDLAVSVLDDLKAMGVRISVDDFGTGYSSLSYLKRLPVDAVKIDQSFVKDITENSDDAAIAGAVVAMAHGLGLEVTAEGVETLDQLEFLRSLNCDRVQGYFISRPTAADDLTQLLTEMYTQWADEAKRAA